MYAGAAPTEPSEKKNSLKPCSTRPDIASAGATAGSERFKCIKELIRRGGRPRRNNSGSRQGLRGSGVPDRAESEMHACISHKLIDMHAARYSWLRTRCRSKAATSSWCRTQTCHLHAASPSRDMSRQHPPFSNLILVSGTEISSSR